MKTAITDSYKKFRELQGFDFLEKFDEVYGDKKIRLVAAKNDEIYFQIIMADAEEFAFSVGKEPYFTVQGPINVYRVEVSTDGDDLKTEAYPVDFIDDDDGLRYSDVLLKSANAYCGKHRPGIVFVKISVPPDATPGKRFGKVDFYSRVMSEDEKFERRLNFEFEIYDVAVPEKKDKKFYLDLWQHSANIARYHEVGLYSDEHFLILEKYVKSLAELGESTVTVIASDAPWCSQKAYNYPDGQSDLFEYSMVRAVKDKSGKFVFDFSAIKKYVELCFRYGIDRDIDVIGLIGVWHDETVGLGNRGAANYPRVRYYDESEKRFKYMASEGEIMHYFDELMRFFGGENWLDKIRIVADEPQDWEAYSAQKSQFEAICPKIRYKTAINHAESMKKIDIKNTDIVPFILSMQNDTDWIKRMAETKGKSKMYYYVCGGPIFPNTFILSDLLECRLIPVLAKHLNLDGFLRWNYTVWPKDPRNSLHYIFHSGDLNFVYPSRGGDVLYSLRYFALKSGITDFELASMADEETLNEYFKIIIKDDGFYSKLGASGAAECVSLEYDDYVRAKTLLLERLSRKK